MKRVFTAFLILVGFFAAHAQSFSVTADTGEISGVVTSTPDLDHFEYVGYLKNTTAGDVSVTWDFADLSPIISPWQFQFCDKVNCFDITSAFHSNTFTLSAGDSSLMKPGVAPHGMNNNVIMPISINVTPTGGVSERKTVYYHITVTGGFNVGIENNSKVQAAVYPNPASNEIFVKGLDENKDYSLELFDVNGKLVLSKVVDKGANQSAIDVSTYERGNYLLSVKAGGDMSVIKISLN